MSNQVSTVNVLSSVTLRSYLPLLCLITICSSWTVYYSMDSVVNDYGRAKQEWLFMLDALIVLPLVCWWAIKDKKEAAVKALAYTCLAVLVGSYIIPDTEKVIWPYLESSRYLVLAGFVVMEILTVATVIIAIRAGLKRGDDVDEAIRQPVERLFGTGVLAQVMQLEARVWTWLLFGHRLTSAENQDKHRIQTFSVHNKDGAQSNALGFILLIAFEIPIVHLLLHFIWSPLAANIISGLTVFSLVFFIAEYRAMAARSVTIEKNDVVIRYGVFNPYRVPLAAIQTVSPSTGFIRRAKHIKRFNFAGDPNIVITLNTRVTGTDCHTLYLGLDNPGLFIEQLNGYCKGEAVNNYPV